MGAVSFLALRAVKAPHYMGEDLGVDDGWSRLMGEVEAIIDAVMKLDKTSSATEFIRDSLILV